MKTNNSERILEAVVAIIERDGLTSVTFDAVATETGITRGGLIYHFRSRDELVQATHEYVAKRWKGRIAALAEERTGGDGALAYILSGGEEPTRAELLLMLEGVQNNAHAAIWSDALETLSPPPPVDGDHKAMNRYIVALASDGLWLRQALAPNGLSRQEIASVLQKLVTGYEDNNLS